MKAVVLHEYGKPSQLKWEEAEDPKPGTGEVLVRVQAASINPIDWKMRSGATAQMFPVTFPAILGRDFAGVVRELGEGVEGFEVGDRVMGLAWATYAQLCVVKAAELTKIPEGLDVASAATVPLVALTADQLLREGAHVEAGQTIVLTGAVGAVGRCALFGAQEMGAKVIAGVRKRQMDEARSLGAVEALNIEDTRAIAELGTVDAVADTVNGDAAAALIGKVKPGGFFGSVLGPPRNGALHPTVQVNAIRAHADPKTVAHYAEALRDGKLKLAIDRVLPMSEAAEGHAAAEQGGVGKIVLTA